MVIQFGEGIQGVKWLGNPSYPRKLHRNTCNFIFFAFFGSKRGLTSMQHVYVRGKTSIACMYVGRLACIICMYMGMIVQ
jgi:hypothetical protein